jgi:hypothetical protein
VRPPTNIDKALRDRALSTEPVRKCNGYGFIFGFICGCCFWMAAAGVYFLWLR